MSKKVVLPIVLIVIIALVGVGYFVYLAPKLKVSSFTQSAAPLAKKDLELNNKLAGYFGKPNDLDKVALDDPVDQEKFIKAAEEAITLLDSSKSKSEDILKDFNKLDTPQDASELMKSFVALNEFYNKSLADLKGTITYAKEISVIQQTSQKELSKIAEPTENATPEQVAAALDQIKTTFDELRSDLTKLNVPSKYADYHEKALAVLGETAQLIGDESDAIKNQDVAKFNLVMSKFAALDSKFNDLKSEDEKFSGSLKQQIDEFNKKEGENLKDTEKQVKDLRTKVGDTWVSKDLQFEVAK